MAETQTGDMFCTDCGLNLHGHGYWLGAGLYCGRCYRVRIAVDPTPPQLPPSIIPTVGALEGGPMPEELRDLGDEEFAARLHNVERALMHMDRGSHARAVSEALRRLEAATDGWVSLHCNACGNYARLRERMVQGTHRLYCPYCRANEMALVQSPTPSDEGGA